MILCTRCQRDNDDDALFCKFCGNRVGVPNPGPEEVYGTMTRSSLGLMDVEDLPPDVARRRAALSRIWVAAAVVVLALCCGSCTVYLGQFFLGGVRFS